MYSYSTIQRRANDIDLKVRKGFLHYHEFVYRDPCGNRIPGYVIEDMRTGFWLWESHDSNFSYLLSLEDVVKHLKNAYEARDLKW